MGWEDRLQEGAYTSPSGIRTILTYENLSVTFDKKTSAYNFPDAEGTFVQDLGHTSRKFPMRIFFWGDNYDLESNVFEETLREQGRGKLEHPVYGTKNVVPFGAITRRDDLKTAANQAVFEITFWESIDSIYPLPQDNRSDNVQSALDAYFAATGLLYQSVMAVTLVPDKISATNKSLSLLGKTKQGLKKIADTIENVQNQFNAIFDSITNTIDTLISTPLALAQSTILLIQSPARALTSITARLGAYKNLIDTTILNASNVFNVYSIDSIDANNDFHTDDLYASSYVSAQVLSVINNQFDTSSEAVAAADLIITQFEDLTEWRDLNFESLGQIDSSAGYQTLQEAVAFAVGFLIEISFTLKQERIIVLDRARTIIDLEVELYGTVDENLDFLIRSNNFSGSSILELQRGQSVVYYA